MNEEEIKIKLINYRVKIFNEINSTHVYAKSNINKLNSNTLVIAKKQTSGIGTHGRVWHTGKDNIAMTLIFKPNCNIYKITNITIKIADCIKKAIFSLYNINLNIKKPNDLMLDDKKVCGILTEINTLGERVKYLLISIGVNVNEENFSDELDNVATSLKKVYKKEFDTSQIIIKIVQNIHEQIIVDLTSQNNRKDI